MSRRTQAGEKFVYIIPIPRAARALAAAVALVLFAIFFGIPLHDLGLARMVETFRSDEGVWAILGAVDGSVIAFFVVLAFPPRSWRARLQFGRDRVCLVPRPVLGWIDGPTVELAFGSRVQEILLCHGTRNRSPYGFRVVVRALDLPDREIKVEAGNNLTLRESRVLTEGIKAATGLPVRLVECIAGKNGVVRELPWTPVTQRAQWTAYSEIAAAILPVAGGILIGQLRPNYMVIIIAGIALWSIEALGLFLLSRFSQQGPKFGFSNWISSLFNFAFAYAIAFAFLTYLDHRR